METNRAVKVFSVCATPVGLLYRSLPQHFCCPKKPCRAWAVPSKRLPGTGRDDRHLSIIAENCVAGLDMFLRDQLRCSEQRKKITGWEA